jgi:hypothetical protein
MSPNWVKTFSIIFDLYGIDLHECQTLEAMGKNPEAR